MNKRINIKPIETIYKGYRFRSRTEARWAVFFDAAGIEWQYEVEGFEINGHRYLPDFWLPRLNAARAHGQPIFIAFENERLSKHFYFACQLAHVAVIAPSAEAAWKVFTRWRDRADA